MSRLHPFFFFFFFNDTATTEIYTLSLHDALPISFRFLVQHLGNGNETFDMRKFDAAMTSVEHLRAFRSEEHTSELQSHLNLVCRLLLEKKKHKKFSTIYLHSHSISDTTPATHVCH